MLEVVEPGPLTTVQGAGRPAAVPLGVPLGGACDRWSLALANALLGNAPPTAALEMTLAGATFRALADCAVAVAGAEMDGRLADGSALPSGAAVTLRAGDTLAFSAAREGGGVRAYLALAGGIDVPEVLDSASTCLVGRFGGLEGRPLRAGDVVRPKGTATMAGGRWAGAASPAGEVVRVLRGPHLDALPAGAFSGLVDGRFTVSGRGDRQGIRLEGPRLPAADADSLVSQPMAWGAVQVPPDGQPIVLLADHQTVGGYPVTAVVIAADLPRLGQLGPADEVRFVEVGADDARRALLEHLDDLATLPTRVRFGS